MKKKLFLLIGLLLVINLVLGVNEILYQMPRLKVWLHIPSKLSQAEQQVFTAVNRPDDTRGYKNAYEIALKIAHKQPKYVEIGSCQADPAIIRVPLSSIARFINDDSQSHKLTFEEKSFTLQAHSFKDIKLDMYHFIPAMYAYYCDDKPAPAGIIFIDRPQTVPQ